MAVDSLIPSASDAFTADVSQRLDEIERRLVQAAEADTAFATSAAQHIISAGGKRFRPLLVVVAALMGNADPEDVTKAALVVELTHVASLYHDDVMDDAELRRAVPSANAKWGNSVAILIGDLLFARASSVVASLGTEYVALQAKTFARLVQGQLAETTGPGDADPLEHYLQVVADKTGSLIATSAVFGGMVAGLEPSQLDALAAFGEEIGVVFQLSDDIIDITSQTSGKTPGTDLRAGVPTLPTLLALRSTDPAHARLRELLRSDLSHADLTEVLELLRAHPAMDAAKAEVRRRADSARGYLAALPDGESRRGLEALCESMISRSE